MRLKAKPAIERLTITLPAKMAAAVRDAVKSGDYASTSEVIHTAVRQWIAAHRTAC